MKWIIKNLSFDSELVNSLKKEKINKGRLYNYLIAGKITLNEYIQALKA
jgi:hypothetical protein